MHPALSVVLFTTLAGAAQGLILALVAAEWADQRHWLAEAPDAGFLVLGAVVAVLLGASGLLASFFHLGRPERAWRAATMWRTSWLSREVIVLPAFLALAAGYALAHARAHEAAFALGALAAVFALILFLCTGMIYACIRFLAEWATPLTPINFTLLGCANGFTLAAALAALASPTRVRFFAVGAIVFTLLALLGRAAARRRNAKLVPKSTLQTAIGIKHRHIEQQSQGFMGGSFNTREFFHGRSAGALRLMRWICLGGAFALPLALLVAALVPAQAAVQVAAQVAAPAGAAAALLVTATLLQYLGLLAERWLFFAEARHPQNLYYQRMA